MKKKEKSLNDLIKKHNDQLTNKIENFRKKRVEDYQDHSVRLLEMFLDKNLLFGDRYQVDMRAKELAERALLKVNSHFPDLNELAQEKLKLMFIELKKSIPEFIPKKGKKDETDLFHERVEPVARQVIQEFLDSKPFEKEMLYLDAIISDEIGLIFRTFVMNIVGHLSESLRESLNRSHEHANLKLWGGIYNDEIPAKLLDDVLKHGKITNNGRQ